MSCLPPRRMMARVGGPRVGRRLIDNDPETTLVAERDRLRADVAVRQVAEDAAEQAADVLVDLINHPQAPAHLVAPAEPAVRAIKRASEPPAKKEHDLTCQRRCHPSHSAACWQDQYEQLLAEHAALAARVAGLSVHARRLGEALIDVSAPEIDGPEPCWCELRIKASDPHLMICHSIHALLAQPPDDRAEAIGAALEKLADVAKFVLDRITNGVTHDERYAMRDAARIAMDAYREAVAGAGRGES